VSAVDDLRERAEREEWWAIEQWVDAVLAPMTRAPEWAFVPDALIEVGDRATGYLAAENMQDETPATAERSNA